MKKLFGLLLCLTGLAHAQTYYPSTTIPPIAPANTFPCNSTAGQAAWQTCALSGFPTGIYTIPSNTNSVIIGSTNGYTPININGFISSEGVNGLLNFCAFKATSSTPCGTTVYADDKVTSVTTNATITLPFTLPQSYVGANIVVSGIGYLGAVACNLTNLGASAGCTDISGGSGYAAGDYVAISGGTASRTASASCSIATTGVLTVTGTVTGTIMPGDVVTSSNITTTTFINGPLINGPATGTGGDGTYQTNNTAGIAAATCTFTPATVIKILTVSGGAPTAYNVVTAGSYSATPASTSGGIVGVNGGANGLAATNGTYTGVSLTGGSGSSAIATVNVVNSKVGAVLLTSPGSGYATSDHLSFSVTGGTCTSCIQPNLLGGNVSQGSTSGSGSGATFTLQYLGLPLQTTISSISGTSVTMATPAITSITSKVVWFAAGYDDTATWNAMTTTAGTSSTIGSIQQYYYMPSLPTPSWLVPTSSGFVEMCYGQFSQWSIAVTQPVDINFGNSCLVALSSNMAWSSQIYTTGSTTNFWSTQQSAINNAYLEGMGLVAYNHEHLSSHWHLDSNVFRDALVANLYVTNPNVSQDNLFSSMQITNDQIVVPDGPSFCSFLDQGMTDNRLFSGRANGCQTGFTTYGADTKTDGFHVFAIYTGNDFEDRNISNQMSGDIADNVCPGCYGFYMHSSSSGVWDWTAFINHATYNGQIGVYLDSNNRNSVGCGVVGYYSDWNTNQIVDSNGSSTNNSLPFSCVGGWTNPYSPAFGTIGIGQMSFNNVTYNGSEATGYGVNNSGSAPIYTATSGNTGVTNVYLYSWPSPTFESNTTTTYTNVIAHHFNPPTCSTGGGGTPTCTNLYTANFNGQVLANGSTVSGGTKFANPTLGTCSGITSTTGGAVAGNVVITTGGTGCTVQFTGLPTSKSGGGYVCTASDETAGIGSVQTAHSTTSCTMKFAGTIGNGDTISWGVVSAY